MKCLAEVNRLRELYRKDLSPYEIPVTSSSKKRKLTASCVDGEPPLKKPRATSKKRKTVCSEQRPFSAPKEEKSGQGEKPSKSGNARIGCGHLNFILWTRSGSTTLANLWASSLRGPMESVLEVVTCHSLVQT